MRTLKSIFAALFVISLMSFSIANDSNTSISTENAMLIEARSNAKNSVDLRLINVQTNKLTIRLKDAAGTVLYFEKVKDQSAYFKHFVLSELPDGNYQFSISQPNMEDVIKTFSIENGAVQIDYIKTVFTPSVRNAYALKVIGLDKDAANVHLVNLTSNKVTMRLKDEAGKVWYFEKIGSHEVYQKRFILNELPDGKYFFAIEGGKEAFEQVLTIKNGLAEVIPTLPRA